MTFGAPSGQVPSSMVAVVTRTKNRPLFLHRAAVSVGSQTFQDYLWIVVNDGGTPEAVDEVVADCPVDSEKTLVFHLEEPLGMEAASNFGIGACRSKYIALHDDDDTWEPSFLTETTAFLENPVRPEFRGVVTRAVKVIETVSADGHIVESCRTPLDGALSAILLSDLISNNVFPNISFVFSREAYEDVGPYREDLPLLGDWEFNLRFHSKYEIGVIPATLANYHHRTDVESGALSNSVHRFRRELATTDAILRNEALRSLIASRGVPPLALSGFGRTATDIKSQLQEIVGGTEFQHRRSGEILYWTREIHQILQDFRNHDASETQPADDSRRRCSTPRPDVPKTPSDSFAVGPTAARIYRNRKDLQSRFPTTDKRCLRGFLEWYLTHGAFEYRLDRVAVESEARQLRDIVGVATGLKLLAIRAVIGFNWLLRYVFTGESSHRAASLPE